MDKCLSCMKQEYLVGFATPFMSVDDNSIQSNRYTVCIYCVRNSLRGTFGIKNYKSILEKIDEIEDLEVQIVEKQADLKQEIFDIVEKKFDTKFARDFVNDEL